MCPKRLPEPSKIKLPLGRAQGIYGAWAEHARSHGTAASAAGIFCCAPFFASTVAGA